ncbi:MAG: KilA-N domain-containing protein [Mesoflavibacter sp.]|nr:KilA-N domain-containing protein [Mesoflavibacter sp.]
MKTEVVMSRPFMGGEVQQKSKSGFFNATAFVKLMNIKRHELGKSNFQLSQFLKSSSTLDFIEELQKENERVVIKSRGRNSATWVHPLLFIDIALNVSPKLKVEVYKWLYDELLKYRNNSGDSYKKMAGSLYDRYPNKQNFYKYITKVANYIQDKCGVDSWNNASQNQLYLRDKMHENISLLCSVMKDTNECVRIGVFKALDDNKDLTTKLK